MQYLIVSGFLLLVSCAHPSAELAKIDNGERLPASTSYKNCADFGSSISVTKINEYYLAAKNKDVSALGFRISNISVALVNDQEAPNCVVVLNGGSAQVLTTSEPLSGLFIFGARFPESVLEDPRQRILEIAMVAAGYTKYLFYNLSNSGRDPFTDVSGIPRYHFQFLIHEGFHHFRQDSFWSQEPKYWPNGPHFNWTSRSGKSFVNGICYRKNLEVKNRTLKEMAALQEAFIVDARLAKEKAREFLKARIGRRQIVSAEQTKLQGWSATAGCNEGEDFLEWVEGSAEFVENSYLLQLELIKPGDLYFSERFNPHSEGFYRFGMLQLFLLQKLDPEFDRFSLDYLQSQGLNEALLKRIKLIVN